MSSSRLAGEIAVITGADSGIGQAIAIAYAREGADVAVTYFKDSIGLKNTCDEVKKLGQRSLCVKLDHRNYENVEYVFEQTLEKLGMPTILVNNAGVNSNDTPLVDLALEDWDLIIKTDLYGPFHCCREFLRVTRELKDSRRRKIINITSVHQEIPMPGASAYDAAKGGLRNLTRTLALEVSDQNVSVNNLAPGMILTPMNQDAIDDPDVRRKAEQHIPLGRAGVPEDIADVAVFMASEESRYIQGETIVVDGGLIKSCGQGA